MRFRAADLRPHGGEPPGTPPGTAGYRMAAGPSRTNGGGVGMNRLARILLTIIPPKRWRASSLVVIAVLLGTSTVLSGCGVSTKGGDEYTLHVEVTSSGSNLAFTGTVSPNNAPNVPISGTTPFSLKIRDTKEECTSIGVTPCISGASAEVTKVTKLGDVLTVCLRNGHTQCTSTTASSNSTTVFLFF
jgi:hypothetical protein